MVLFQQLGMLIHEELIKYNKKYKNDTIHFEVVPDSGQIPRLKIMLPNEECAQHILRRYFKMDNKLIDNHCFVITIEELEKLCQQHHIDAPSLSLKIGDIYDWQFIPQASANYTTSIINDHQAESVTQGPRFKGKATIQFEKLIKDILRAHHNKKTIQVSYNQLNEMIISVNDEFYNLAQILKNNPDLEQLSFNQTDLQNLNEFLLDPATTFYHIELDLDKGDDQDKEETREAINHMKKIFPDLSLAELSTIRNYTGGIFYSAINYLLRSNAGNRFPQYQNDGSNLNRVIKKIAQKHNTQPDVNNPIILNALVTEILVNAGMISFALSKSTQLELKLCAASSLDELVKNIDKVNGVTLALVSNLGLYDVYMIAYGNIINQSSTSLNIREWVKQHTLPNSDGVVLSPSEAKEIEDSLDLVSSFCLLESIQGLLLTKLIDILMSLPTITDLMYEKIYRGDVLSDFFKKTYLPSIYSDIKSEGRSLKFVQGFYSASGSIDQIFIDPESRNVVTTLINPVLWGKNIESVSRSSYEKERLLIHTQQISYTAYTDQNDDKDVTLFGAMVRSIDGINPFSYSHEAILLREAILGIQKIIADYFEHENKDGIKDVITSQLSTIIDQDMNAQQKLIEFSRLLALYYLNRLYFREVTPSFFGKTTSTNLSFSNAIYTFMKDFFGIELPKNRHYMMDKASVSVSLSEKFIRQTNFGENCFIFDAETIKNIFIHNGNATSLVNGQELQRPSGMYSNERG